VVEVLSDIIDRSARMIPLLCFRRYIDFGGFLEHKALNEELFLLPRLRDQVPTSSAFGDSKTVMGWKQVRKVFYGGRRWAMLQTDDFLRVLGFRSIAQIQSTPTSHQLKN
jgi:hypothetical protein